jgi:hypothetical protein
MARDLTESQQTALRRGAVVLNRVNEREIERRSCERLVERSARGWRMTERGQEWAELLTYTP